MNPDTGPLGALADKSKGDREERAVGFRILTFILRNLKWSGERHQGKKKSNFSLEKNRNTQVEHNHTPPNSSPQITLWERKNAVGPQHPFRWACVKLREKKERKATIFETMRCLCSQASDIVALQGSEEDGWWVQCPVLTRTPESSPKMKGFHLKHRGPTLPWLTQCEAWIFNFLPPTIHSAQAHIFYWKCIMTCMLVVYRAADLLHGVLESTEP